MQITVADLLFSEIVKKGIDTIFLVPGGGNMFLVDAAKRNKNLKIINCFHEQAASIAAEGYFRSSGKVGVALVTSGPGSTNAITGVIGSWIDSIPIILISGQVKLKDQIGKLKIRQRGPQEVQLIDSIKKFTKFSVSFKNINNIHGAIVKALEICEEGRKGPVWLDIPLDIQNSIIFKNKLSSKKKKNKKFKKTDKNKKIISYLNNIFKKSKKPIILIGHGIRLANEVESVKKLINKINVPTLLTWNAMDILSYDHKLNFGSPGVVAQRYSNIAIQKSDLIISIGARLDNIVTAFDVANFGINAKKVVFDIDKNELKKLPKNFKKFNLGMKEVINNLKKIKIQKNYKWNKYLINIKNKYQFIPTQKNKKLLNHYYFSKVLSECIKNNSIISVGSSGFAIEAMHVSFKTKENQRLFTSPGLGAMGYGLPQAIGACCGNKQKKIIAIETDGSFMFNLQEMATLKSYNLPIALFILNNDGYLSIRNTQKNYFKERYVGTGREDNIFYPDFKNIANSFKIKYFSLFNQKNIKEKIKKILSYKRPCLINVMLERNDTLKPKVGVIFKNNKIESMPIEDMNPLLSIRDIEEIMGNQISEKSYQIRKK